jgi:hypothetical protein
LNEIIHNGTKAAGDTQNEEDEKKEDVYEEEEELVAC